MIHCLTESEITLIEKLDQYFIILLQDLSN